MAASAKLFTNTLNLVQALDSGTKKDLLPHVPAELRGHYRWLQATVVNKTPYTLHVDDTFFNSGKYFRAPADVSPHGQMTFSCCNSSFLAGCAGATRFEADVEGGQLGFIIGWTNPAEGRPKVSAVADYHPTKTGYDRADNSVSSATSEYGTVFVDESGDSGSGGKARRAKLKITARPHGWEPVYIVEKVVEDA